MSTIDDGGPAFPGGYPPPETPDAPAPVGMSLRDYFAAHALPVARNARPALGHSNLANDAYRIADAMLKARKQDWS